MIECPAHLLYSQRHLWVDVEDEEKSIAKVGITQYHQEGLGEIQSADLPLVGDELEIDVPCAHLHIEDELHHLLAPLTGRVESINRDVLDNPALLHIDPYQHWLFRMEFDEPDEFELLLSPEQYIRVAESL